MSLRKKTLFILIFLIPMLGCNAGSELLEAVNYWAADAAPMLFHSYERECEEDGGIWVVDEKTGEGKCEMNWGNPIFLEDEVPVEEAAPSLDELPVEENSDPALDTLDEVDISDLAGTYVGTTNFLDFHIEDWGGGAITQNEITITISEDGIVGGTFIVRFESSQKSNESCVWHVFRTQSGTIFGQISQSIGTIKFDYTSKQELFRNCLGGNATTVNDLHDEFHITISEKTMIGSGDGSKTFEATKQ